jgi:hypothetical protein
LDKPAISLIVVSRDRADALAIHLSCLRLQTVVNFETIVVSNLPLSDGPKPSPLIHIDCQEANISLARNIGLQVAQGEIVVFCDDDCLPDPSFLEHIIQPFENPTVGAAGGVTRSRNGVATQWSAAGFGRDGLDFPVPTDRRAAYTVFPPEPDRFIKTVGTACAFRRHALNAIGGFDPEYRYLFDETDVNLRLSEAGWSTAIVPGAQVHHGFAAGPYRNSRRVPRDLFESSASSARFVRLHTRVSLDMAIAKHRQQLRRHAFSKFNLGLMDGKQLGFLCRRIDEGLQHGATSKAPSPKSVSNDQMVDPMPIEAQHRDHFMLLGTPEKCGGLARELVALGKIVTVLDIQANAQPLWVRFDLDGYWHHRGGLFGQIDRKGYLVQFRSRSRYVETECARLDKIRPVHYLLSQRKLPGRAVFLPELAHIAAADGFNIVKLGCKAPQKVYV